MKPQPAIKRVAILGAGVMGAQIAARLADAGIPCDLLDLVVDEKDRNQLALGALKRLQEMKPAPFYDAQALYLIRPGNLEDHLERIREADWVLEAIVEDLEAKQNLWKKVLPYTRPDALLSTNTSGLPIARIAEVFSPEDRRRFMGTHFFNPVRYMKLLEIIPLPETRPELVERIIWLGEKQLGKGIVLAKDAPNFIANRIGTYAFQVAVQEMMKRSLSVETMDVITGPALGHPKSATFRTLDLVGLDTYVHVADNLRQAAQDDEDRQAFAVPDFIRRLVEEGALGEKAGRGVYRRSKGPQGETVIEALDWQSLSYRPQEKPRFASVGAALKKADPVERVKTFLSGDDEAAEVARAITYRVLGYAARRAKEIAPSIQAVDEAMRWGFNWELGPFQLWDALGFKETLEALRQAGEALPDWIGEVEAKGGFYDEKGQPALPAWEEIPGLKALSPRPYPVGHYLRETKVWRTDDATLVDLGEDVAGLILHGEKDALNPGTFEALARAIDEVEASWRGLVVASAGENFSVGANLFLVLMAVQSGAVDQVEEATRAFQDVNMKLKYARRPVVVAVHGLTLGGGAEMVLAAPAVQAALESYIGLVEVGAGLIPGGGGTKERWVQAVHQVPPDAPVDLNALLQWVFQTIALARVSTGAVEARLLGYLGPEDGISVDRDRLLQDARRRVILMDEEGYQPRLRVPIPVAGKEGKAQLLLAVDEMWRGRQISDHDRLIATHLAHVLSGGDLPAGTLVDEQHFLDLEREAFIALVKEEKTQARMAHLLQTGKPLRN